MNPDSLTPDPRPQQPQRYPFWTWGDLVIFIGMILPCLLLGLGVVKIAFWVLNLHPAVQTWDLILSQFAGYALIFFVLFAIFRLQYGCPFWESLAWNKGSVPVWQTSAAAMIAVIAVSLLGSVLRLPPANPMLDLLKDRTSIALIAIFGVTLGPLCEELAFRGFLQPLTVRALGVVPGILAAAFPFGMLHFWEYGKSWKHVLLITLAGVGFGWMRQLSGSTRAAVLMHALYNGIQFVAFIFQSGYLAH